MKKVFGVIIAVFIGFLIILSAFSLYKLCYKLMTNTDYSTLLSYSDFDVIEDNMSPQYQNNDLAIIKKCNFYNSKDIILYKAKVGYRLGEVADMVGGFYIIKDNVSEADYENQINPDDIVGKAIHRIKNFASFYEIVTSVYSMILCLLILICYFALSKKERSW